MVHGNFLYIPWVRWSVRSWSSKKWPESTDRMATISGSPSPWDFSPDVSPLLLFSGLWTKTQPSHIIVWSKMIKHELLSWFFYDWKHQDEVSMDTFQLCEEFTSDLTWTKLSLHGILMMSISYSHQFVTVFPAVARPYGLVWKCCVPHCT